MRANTVAAEHYQIASKLCEVTAAHLFGLTLHLSDKSFIKTTFRNFNPRPGRPFSITRPGRGGVDAPPPPGVSKLSVVALREKDQSIALDEYSRLVVYLFTLGQHLT